MILHICDRTGTNCSQKTFAIDQHAFAISTCPRPCAGWQADAGWREDATASGRDCIADRPLAVVSHSRSRLDWPPDHLFESGRFASLCGPVRSVGVVV